MQQINDPNWVLGNVEGLSVTMDELGQCVTIVIHDEIFDIATVFKTAYWFSDNYYIFMKPHKFGLEVELRLKDPGLKKTDPTIVAGEFMNALLDQRVRQIVHAETGEIRARLVQKAFFEGRKRTIVQS
ncbi:His-Xaa-Ser system protein HxsD [Rhodobacteraceae bacterium RKSG542]|uniref:His-Xaa-Ser system protein HxsD n=1 Tax=Pseudovibrio flavus TaxID=2529854 RepID=UPI0012BC96E1|nr:His-Xaa-Ser system protein HxsD [Pseudovibrio flavus]MTI15768.1 His-Xaa-Ser system protein HxsD [Pseudovibrio flavus]